MGSNIKLMIVTLFSVLFLLQGCSGGGGGSTSGAGGGGSTSGAGGGGSTSGGGNVSNTISKKGLFTLKFVDKNVNVFDYKLSIKRGEVELTDTLLQYISSKKQDDGSIVITLKKVTTDGKSKGLTTLAVGDVITLEAKGYTAQQFVVDENMLKSDVAKLSLKPIESRQTYNLSDMTQGSDSVSARSARGARTVVTDKGVTFETLHSGISLTMPKMTYERLARKISRLPRSNTNTKVYIDMTSIDPQTEHDATIGNFSYDASSEPANERTTNAVGNSGETGLESVVMADLKMTTDSGDEIHCFGDGEYDPKTDTCSDDTMATLKMQIPESQFKKYAQKYNDGDRVVPLYSYDKEKATWVRQVKNGKAIDAELVLTDNDNNQKANAGDVLTLVGKVGHFSWWNGDWGIQRTCLNVPVDLTNAPDASSYVLVKGVDYTGREYTKYVSSDTTEVKGISAKENSIVDISLIMSDGSVGDSFTYATSAQSSECENVNATLVAPEMQKHDVKVVVKDTQGNLLQNASVESANTYAYTDANGSANLTFAYSKDLNQTVYVYYYFDGSTISAKKQVTQSDENLTFQLDTRESSFSGSVVESINGQKSAASNTYVEIYNYNPYYYKSVMTDANGFFTIKIPKSLTKDGTTANIYIYKYDEDYAFYPEYAKDINLSSSNLGTFTLAFSTHEVSGQVSDTQGKPIPNAGVYAYGTAYKSVTSDENGNYHFTLLGDVNGNETLQAYTYQDGYHYSEQESFITEENGSTAKDLTIDLRKAIIKGRVLTSKGLALSNMRVYWSKDRYNYTTTDKDGYFTLETYNGGDGKISVYNPSSYKFLDLNDSEDVRDVTLNEVAVGNIYDLGNLLSVDSNFAPIINAIAIDPSTPLSNVPFVINVDAYDPDGDPITYKVENYYYGGSVGTIKNNNTVTITENSSGYYYFKVTATDTKNHSTQKIVSVYVKDHVRPVIDSVSYAFPHNKTYFDKSKDMNVQVEAHSIEGNSLSYAYSLENLLNGNSISLDATDSNVTIPKDTENGKYKLLITVSDLYNATTISKYITVDNTVAPEIDTLLLDNNDTTSLSVKQGASVSFDVNLTDEQNVNDATWYWYVNGETFTTQKIDPITFDTEGTYYGYVTVRDAMGRSDYKSFYINVQKDAKPVIDSVKVSPAIITKESDHYVDGRENNISDITLSIKAHDDDNNQPELTYTFGNLDKIEAQEKNDNNATFSLKGLGVGRYSVLVTVSDGTKSVQRYVNIEVLKDTPPVITEFRVPLKTKVGSTIQLATNATDANGEALTYSWSSTAGTLTNEKTKNASLKVSLVKDINVTLQVSDGVNIVKRVRTLNVLDNTPPEITYFDLRTLSVTPDNQNIKLKAIYGDIDGSVKSAKYIVINDKNETQYEKPITQSGVVTNLALNLAEGKYKVYLKVTDDDNATTESAKASFTVGAKNSAPTITSLTATSKNLLVDEKTTLNLAANDVDGDALTVSWSADGGSVIRDSVSQDKAIFSADKAGKYTITAIATDTGGLKAIKTVVITVQNASLSVNSDKTSYILGDEVTLTATMSSGDTLPSTTSWSIESKPDGSTLSTTANGASITLTPDVVGTYKVKADTTIKGVSFSAEYAFSVEEQNSTKPDLEGSVTSDTGDQLSGAKVRLYNKTDATIYDVTVTTDSSGAYSFSDVPAGSYYLVVYAGNGYVSQTQVVEISK